MADRLSALPPPILVDIISRLPTDDMVRTSVLSKRWRSLWIRSPVLHFTRAFSHDIEPEDLPAIVEHCIRLCTAPIKLRSVRFPLCKVPPLPASVYNRWISFAAARGVEELTLSPNVIGRMRVDVPLSLFGCRLLSTLRLSGCTISLVPTGARFPNLRTLSLTHVSIVDSNLVSLVSAAPRIENLHLSYIRELIHVRIDAPTVRHLMVHKCAGLRRVEILRAPELRRLMYRGDLSILGSLQGVAPNLEEAILLSTAERSFENRLTWRDFIAAIAHVKILSVNNWFFEFMLGENFNLEAWQNMFENLKEFHFWPVFKQPPDPVAEPWQAEFTGSSLCSLVSFLGKCPSLEHLCIFGAYYLKLENEECEFGATDSEESSDDEHDGMLQEFEEVACVLPHLKTFSFTEFSGKKEEKQLVRFLLERAGGIRSLCLHYVEEMEHEMVSIRREMEAFPASSPLAVISFSKFDEDMVCAKHDHIWYQFIVV